MPQKKDRREGRGRRCYLGTYLNAALTIYTIKKDDMNKSFWKNIHCGRMVVWSGVKRMIN